MKDERRGAAWYAPRYRLVRDFDCFKAGEVVRLPRSVGEALVDAGVLEEVR